MEFKNKCSSDYFHILHVGVKSTLWCLWGLEAYTCIYIKCLWVLLTYVYWFRATGGYICGCGRSINLVILCCRIWLIILILNICNINFLECFFFGKLIVHYIIDLYLDWLINVRNDKMDDTNFQNSLCITSMKQKLSGPIEAHGPFINIKKSFSNIKNSFINIKKEYF